ncbi:MAG: hypothetical protein KJ592_00630 [Nanoarchaeota archaeon]|nr:hypothetical protein [Nanoarchaeota archaeon]
MGSRSSKIEIVIVLLALFFTISSLIISFLFPELQILVLTILTLLLPGIYQIGHIIAKEYIRAKNEKDFSELQYFTDVIKKENESMRKRLEKYGEEFEEDSEFSSSESSKKVL